MKKIINRLFMAVAITAMISACNSFDLDLQDNPLAVTPANASVNDLYNSIQLDFGDFYSATEGNPGAVARMYHFGGFTYNAATTPNTYNFAWNTAYAGLFPDIDNVLLLAEANGLDIHAGTVKIMKAYTMMVLVDLFGDVPFSEAGQGTDIISPNVDSGQDVYNAAIALLDEAIAQLDGTVAGAPAFDNFYGGDPEGWIKFANTLKLRAALNTGDASTINTLVSGGMIIDEAGEDFQINFGNQRTNPNSRHPFYNNHYEVGDGAYLSNYYMWLLRRGRESEITDGVRIDDPRRRYYFYRKVSDAEAQDATTYSCHFTALPTDDPGTTIDHWTAIDPNLAEVYCVVADGYSGRDHGNGGGIPPDGPIRTSYGLYPGGGDFDDSTFDDTRANGTLGGLGQGIFPIMLSSFVDFMRAEAALSLGTADDARALLESGIRKSLDKVEGFESLVATKMGTSVELRDGSIGTIKELFGMSDADKDDYVAEILAIYDAATTAQERIDVVVTEYYIAAWGNGLEAYNMYRRTGFPSNIQPTLEVDPGQFPNTFFYPVDFVTRNSNVDTKPIAVPTFWQSLTNLR
ncbi:MAG: SusD/RagB family nutrient-binding outer membrane lipoprotein [Cytophagales bacterium]|nr:SusD/RagB family nutrient-binding outer membrane lipoprotein [Cytophagales bacterium]